MTEDRLQYECVTWFHNNFRESRGALFEVNNKTNKGAYRKGLGTVPGASDLVHCTKDGRMVGIELKANGTRHEVNHVQRQLNWGRMMQQRGGEYIFIFDYTTFKDVLYLLEMYGTDMIKDQAKDSRCYVESLIDAAKKKGVKSIKMDYHG